jgi:hypothetical protein
MNEAWVYSIGTLFFGLFHLAALTLAIVNWKQYPTVCLLVLAGSLLNLSAIGARIALPTIWFQLFHDRLIFAFLNLGISLVNLSGSALYLIAIFAERSSYHRVAVVDAAHRRGVSAHGGHRRARGRRLHEPVAPDAGLRRPVLLAAVLRTP